MTAANNRPPCDYSVTMSYSGRSLRGAETEIWSWPGCRQAAILWARGTISAGLTHKQTKHVLRAPGCKRAPSKTDSGGLLIIRKIIKLVASRCHILRLKCTKFDFDWSSAPDPAGVAQSAPPEPLAEYKGSYFEGKEEGWKKKEEGKGSVMINIGTCVMYNTEYGLWRWCTCNG